MSQLQYRPIISSPSQSDVIFAESSTPLSPSKARAAPQHNKAQASKVGQKTPGAWIWEFSELPDPDGHYAGLLNAHPDLTKAQVVSPDVCDQQGVLIAPGEYDTKIMHNNYVEVEVLLKLWNILPSTRAKNQNGSHVYQLILKSMKLLPYHSYTHANLLKVNTMMKGKRRCNDDDDNDFFSQSSPTKKSLVLESERDMDFEVV
ncbi:hypothetical protein EDC04DRAFT_2607938 [Pisolithus marmoratus]|nr:hypothetical protein EDC04DRAFT_2607938 [Pisolithus marmoratus]